jgi:flagellar motility protein MotE (MotC chaperone)
MKTLIRARIQRALVEWVGPFVLFVLTSGGVWVALSSPQLPAEDHKAEAGASPVPEASGSGTPGKEAGSRKKKRKPAAVEEAPQCLTDENAIADIKRRHEELDLRQREIDSRATELELKEKALGEQLAKIEAVRADIQKTEELRSKEQGAKVGKVVDTFETMTPKSVSAMLAAMDETLAVEAMNRMTTPKLAKVLNLMEPVKSSRLTELLVGMRARSAASPADIAPGKGGDKKNSDSVSGSERSPAAVMPDAGGSKDASEKGGE